MNFFFDRQFLIKTIRKNKQEYYLHKRVVCISKKKVPLRTSLKVFLQSFLPARGFAMGEIANIFFFSFSFWCDFSTSLSLPISLSLSPTTKKKQQFKENEIVLQHKYEWKKMAEIRVFVVGLTVPGFKLYTLINGLFSQLKPNLQ